VHEHIDSRSRPRSCQQANAWDPFRHDEEAQRLLDPMARSAAVAAETQLQVTLIPTVTLT